VLGALWVNVQVLQVAQYMCLLCYILKNKKSECLVGTHLGLIIVFDKCLGRTLGQCASFAGRAVYVPPPLHFVKRKSVCLVGTNLGLRMVFHINVLCALWVNVQILQVAHCMRLLCYIEGQIFLGIFAAAW